MDVRLTELHFEDGTPIYCEWTPDGPDKSLIWACFKPAVYDDEANDAWYCADHAPDELRGHELGRLDAERGGELPDGLVSSGALPQFERGQGVAVDAGQRGQVAHADQLPLTDHAQPGQVRHGGLVPTGPEWPKAKVSRHEAEPSRCQVPAWVAPLCRLVEALDMVSRVEVANEESDDYRRGVRDAVAIMASFQLGDLRPALWRLIEEQRCSETR